VDQGGLIEALISTYTLQGVHGPDQIHPAQRSHPTGLFGLRWVDFCWCLALKPKTVMVP